MRVLEHFLFDSRGKGREVAIAAFLTETIAARWLAKVERVGHGTDGEVVRKVWKTCMVVGI
jgi:hypothetical protein